MVQLNRPHIGIFGRMNVGKSSLINALSGQQVALVSPQAGTTTDPVKKTMEILGIGPVVLIDTAGIDDTSVLGEQRVKKTEEIFEQIDLAILVFAQEFGRQEQETVDLFRRRNIPFVCVHNKQDLFPQVAVPEGILALEFSCARGDNTGEILRYIANALPKSAFASTGILDGYVHKNDEVVLVIPIDASAPAGRLILPQVQTIRNLLDIGAAAVCVKDTELADYLQHHTPTLVVTDSQAFATVNAIVPQNIPLTSFSILFSRVKGDFEAYLAGTRAISRLRDGDKVLMMESCSHSVNKCDDIGRTKIPNWLRKCTGKKLSFDILSHLDPLPEDVQKYKLAVQCGGCMVTRIQILRRLEALKQKGVPVSNYGLTIAYCTGIFERATELFK